MQMDEDIRNRLAEGSFEGGFELLLDRYKHRSSGSRIPFWVTRHLAKKVLS